ncbi:LacI family DNA-binding transcriptional regulator [Nesterenkonia aerolata]|uniref:LacI family DNA-binding transcriptional regulator n=1 Tax=Nesterenkonia aerolata TaxID=3074079 RepID=A0ABU2DTH9_9MICC|nr:LacI family DNA-binding transcriptional regulator [Nesterenkonia sp. LY-0111]MDR8019813.1 LacI family DNA-binding transcriptional regulator [Nesterenkonia sp. LY-0111]
MGAGQSGRRSPTLVEIARAAGVSKSAVSLALRGEVGISEPTRYGILRAARSLGRPVTPWAPGADLDRDGPLIGVLVNGLQSAYHRDVEEGVQSAAPEGVRLVIAQGGADRSRLQEALRTLVGLGVDGLVIISSRIPPTTLEEVGRWVPTAVVGRLSERIEGVDVVFNNDAHGVRLAVHHLFAAGHRRIVHLTGSSRPVALHRQRAFVELMRGVVPEVEPRVEGPQHLEAAIRSIVAEVRAGGLAPTAVFAQTDEIAGDLMVRCFEAGVEVPEGLSIVGYDASSLSRFLRPALTSVNQPRHELGSTALQLVLDRFEGSGSSRVMTLRPSLTRRDSVAPPS